VATPFLCPFRFAAALIAISLKRRHSNYLLLLTNRTDEPMGYNWQKTK